MEVPIVGWSSNVTMANRAVEEFAYNTSGITTAGASDITSFGYGLAGAAIGSIASTTVTGNSRTKMRVRFQTPIQATDKITIKFNDGTNAGWLPVSGADNLMSNLIQGAANYGIGWGQVNSTDIDVFFGNGGRFPSNATYAAAGGAWSGVSANKWIVEKVSGGASVGYPIGARNVVGDTSGTTVPTGYIGEMSGSATAGTGGSSYSTTTTTVTPATTPAAVVSVTLNKGVYFVSASVTSYRNASDELVCTLRVGGTAVSLAHKAGIASANSGCVTIAMPILITADSTVVAMYANMGTVATTSANAISAVRIA
jgi:hypothetical protein